MSQKIKTVSREERIKVKEKDKTKMPPKGQLQFDFGKKSK